MLHSVQNGIGRYDASNLMPAIKEYNSKMRKSRQELDVVVIGDHSRVWVG